MKTIIFVCHGNICRSVTAEYIMKSLSKDYIIYSRATRYEEIGNDIYPPMKRVLLSHDIPISTHRAQRIDNNDYLKADYIFYMDDNNHHSLVRMFGLSSKIMPISKWTPSVSEIEDPWYTGRYHQVYKQIYRCILDILNHIK